MSIVYGASLGCLPAIFAACSRTVKLNYLILDGAENVSFGIFNPLMTRVVAKLQGKIVKKVVHGEAQWLVKMLGMKDYTPAMLAEMIYTGATEKTLEHATIAGATFYNKKIKGIEPRPGIKTACWYGAKEGNMKSAIKGLKTVFPNMEVKEFANYGHGEILQHPDQLLAEIDRFTSP